MTPENQNSKSPAVHSGIWVIAEQNGGFIRNVCFELVSKGRELADTLQTGLSAVCFGAKIRNTDELISCGADKVLLIEDDALANNDEDVLAGALVSLIKEHKPEIVLGGATALGRSLLPRVAARLQTGLTADCIDLSIDSDTKLLVQTCTGYGGNVLAHIVCAEKRPQMATVRPRVFQKKLLDGRKGEILRLPLNTEGVKKRTRLIESVKTVQAQGKIEEASVLVAGGRGLAKADDFKMLEELAAALGGAVAATRPPVDEGWVTYHQQVGQTGKTVRPRLYIAAGISGAVHHTAGMQTSDCIVAINTDPNAPIFDIATFGIVGDLYKIVPLLIQKLAR